MYSWANRRQERKGVRICELYFSCFFSCFHFLPRPVQDLVGEEMRKALEDLRKGLERLKVAKKRANVP